MTLRLPLRKLGFGFVIALSVLTLQIILNTKSVSALSGNDFRANHIVDDIILYNGNAMSASDIQSFLNAKVPTCDTSGTQASTHWNDGANRYFTRSEWGTAHGYPPPYTCLKNYSESVPTKVADAYCTGTFAGGTKSASQIIADVGVACSISQKSMIVLLQKEQALVTDDWPWSVQYRSATGYGCPDTAACDSTYYGFFNQVYNAARQYQRYAKQPTNYNYRAGLTSFVQYNPNSGCSGTNVAVDNAATAGLYNYTPYQPNSAALNNLYGTGDGCSAYGNRNFWRLYSDWFDFNPSSMVANSVTMNTVATPDSSPARGQTITYIVTFTNNLSIDLPINAAGIVGRLGDVYNGANRDFGWQGPFTLHPGIPQQFTFTTTIHDTGHLYAWPALNYQGTYVHYNNWGVDLNAHLPKLTITSPLASSAPSPVAGQTATISATVRNDEDQPLTLDTIGIPVRYYNTYTYDTGWASSSTIQPGESKVVTGPITFDKAGPYTAWLSVFMDGQYTTLSNTLNITTSKVTPNFGLSYTQYPNQTPAVGEDVSIKFKLKNNSGVAITLDAIGIVGRYDNPYSGPNRDFGWVGPVTFSAGEEKSYTDFVSNVSETKNFYSWIALNYQGSYIHYNNWGFILQPHLPNITLSNPLTINSGTTPVVGNPVTVTATLKNNEPKSIKYTAVGIPARYYNAFNYDLPWQSGGTLAASGQSGDNVTVSGTINFDKHGPYTIWPSLYFNGLFQTIGPVKSLNL